MNYTSKEIPRILLKLLCFYYALRLFLHTLNLIPSDHLKKKKNEISGNNGVTNAGRLNEEKNDEIRDVGITHRNIFQQTQINSHLSQFISKTIKKNTESSKVEFDL